MTGIEPIGAKEPASESVDVIAENIEALRGLFPNLVTEGADGAVVDLDVLKTIVGDKTASEGDEKYGLSWHGKRQALQLAQTPSTGTLRPCPQDSVNWDTTQNLMIEGDNLEVLKLLQKSYAGKVKLIYIDPPYNTGKDFVYKDNYRDSIKNYLEQTGQTDEEGHKTSSNTEASGRYHTDWLNMMYPRLVAAKILLRADGVLFVSIGSAELADLAHCCDTIFGESNRLGIVSRITKTTSDAGTFFAPSIDYLLAYTPNVELLDEFKVPLSESQVADYKQSDRRGPYKLVGFYQASLTLERSRNARYEIKAPDGSLCLPPEGKRWRTVKATYDALVEAGEIEFVATDSSPLIDQHGEQSKFNVYTKQYLERRQQEGRTPRDFIDDAHNHLGSREVIALDMQFDFPKPTRLVKHLLSFISRQDQKGIVLDFFAGSGTTGHAVMAQNAEDGGSRRYILVQLPEPLSPEVKEQKTAAEFCDELDKPRNIAELTKERLRRAAAKVAEENPDYKGDLGFRVFKLDSSNLREWDENPDDLPANLEEAAEHVKANRTDQDVLHELLLKQGIDLCVPIETKEIAGHTVQSVGSGTLITCLDQQISQEDTEPLGLGIANWHTELNPAGETTCIFRDSAFPNDIAKTNLTAILNQHNITTIRSI